MRNAADDVRFIGARVGRLTFINPTRPSSNSWKMYNRDRDFASPSMTNRER